MYYDPDVLPASVKQWLPIQEPKGHGMSLEEYEKWRAQQSKYPDASPFKKQAAQEEDKSSEEDDEVAPPALTGEPSV